VGQGRRNDRDDGDDRYDRDDRDGRRDRGNNAGRGSQERFPQQRVAFGQCYRTFQPTGRSQADVAELGKLCGAPCGMIPLTPIKSGRQQATDDVDVYPVELRGDRCYRFIAVGSDGIDDLDSAIADRNNDMLMRDTFPDAAPILGPEGPFCPRESGRYQFVVSVAKGGGTYHYQIWQGRGNR